MRLEVVYKAAPPFADDPASRQAQAEQARKKPLRRAAFRDSAV
jgi:hypothetical protein